MRISIIDDNEPVSSAFAIVFKSRGDQTDCYSSGEEFFAAEAQNRADCILVDLRLPGMNGCEIIRNLRENSIQTPAILLSGNIDDDLFEPIAHYDHVRVMRKPCPLSDLCESIEELCSQYLREQN